MPEGDTILRAARTLDRSLAGTELRTLAMAPVRDRGSLRQVAIGEGASVTGVEARGKHLLFQLGDGRTLHSHMGMTGSWHVYRPGETWMRPERQARAVLKTDDAVAVCFSPQTLELLSGERDGSGRLARLGPDLSREDPDLAEAVRRLRTTRTPDTEIGVALLDQRISAGIGNVYKSETLFACGIDPFAPIGTLEDEQLATLFETASRLLRSNATTLMRTTVPHGLAVYGRAPRPCHACGTAIRSRQQGEHARTTYWCPTCQTTPAKVSA